MSQVSQLDDTANQLAAHCREILAQRSAAAPRRVMMKGHPALVIGEALICLDTNAKQLLVGPSSAREALEASLPEARRHAWTYNPEPYVSYLCFVLTTRCSLQCRYCFSSSPTLHSELTPDLARRMAQRVPDLFGRDRYPRISFFGGEPTLNLPAIDAMMDELDWMDVDVIPVLMTNGIFGTETLDRITGHHLLVQFSYDGAANNLRMTPSQEATLRANIRACAERGLPINIRPTISAANVEHLVELVEDVAELAGEQLVTINCGILNLNKGAALSLEPDLSPDPIRFGRNWEAMIERARELGVRISSIQLTDLRSDSTDPHHLPAFVTTDGLVGLEAVYDSSNRAACKLVYGRFDRWEDRFVIDGTAIQRLQQNYLANAFLHDEQRCYAQSLCHGLKKAIKNCREVYAPNHLGFFRQDVECAAMRAMVEAYLIDMLKVMSQPSSGNIGVSADGALWRIDAQELAFKVY